jgi:phage shock protein A
LKGVIEDKRRLKNSRERAEKVYARLVEQLASLKVNPNEDWNDELDSCESAADEQDNKITDLNREIAEADEEISDTKEKLDSEAVRNRKRISVGVLADFEGAINIALIYGGSFYILPVYYSS